MLFNSLHFCIFFPLVTFLYFIVAKQYAWLILFLASCYFYMSWQPFYSILLAIAILVNYFSSIAIEQTESRIRKKVFLIFSIIVTFGLLFIFKYSNFFYQSLAASLQWLGLQFQYSPLSITLPVGISFFTFQTMSYTLDVFYGKQKTERNLARFALFITYFPQLVAGPIERAGNLLEQLHSRKKFTYHNAIVGLRTFLGGMLLKIVFADNFSKYVDAVYNNVHDYRGWPLLVATYLFAFQIFCDFAGYSYMAIGIARVMGINLMENFRQPYLAASIKDFWKRWHISLSSWFCDYVYIPLGGSKVSLLRYHMNIMITFLLSGLWHGSNWTFVLWGALNGFYMIIATFLPARLVHTVPYFFRMIITFSAVCFSWIFFRANSLTEAWYILQHMFVDLGQMSTVLQLRRAVVVGRSLDLPMLLLLTMLIWFVKVFQQHAGHIRYTLDRIPQTIRFILYYGGIASLFLLGEFGGHQFIYFQF